MADHAPPSLAGRRRLLDWAARVFLSLWGVGFLAVVLSFLKGPRSRRERAGGDRVLHAGSLESLPVGQGRLVRHGSQPVLVVRPRPDQVVALSAICTHLRCVLRWDAQRSLAACPCHAGSFDIQGNVLAGPPGAPLPRYSAEVRGGEIYVRV